MAIICGFFKRKQICYPKTEMGYINKVKHYRFVEILQKDIHKRNTHLIWIVELLLIIQIKLSNLLVKIIITTIQSVR